MDNNLGHGEVSNKAAASGSSADSQRPPSGTNSGEVPAPMEPMNPIPVPYSDKLGLPLGSNLLGLESVGSDPRTKPRSPRGLNKPIVSSNDVDQQIYVSAHYMFSQVFSQIYTSYLRE
jgi:hypothetical protein